MSDLTIGTLTVHETLEGGGLVLMMSPLNIESNVLPTLRRTIPHLAGYLIEIDHPVFLLNSIGAVYLVYSYTRMQYYDFFLQ